MVNWHDLFKYTYMGRAITATMTAVRRQRWRGLRFILFSSRVLVPLLRVGLPRPQQTTACIVQCSSRRHLLVTLLNGPSLATLLSTVCVAASTRERWYELRFK